MAYVTTDGGTTAPPDGIVRRATLLRVELQPHAAPGAPAITISFLDRHPDFQASHAGSWIEFRTIKRVESGALEGLVARLG